MHWDTKSSMDKMPVRKEASNAVSELCDVVLSS